MALFLTASTIGEYLDRRLAEHRTWQERQQKEFVRGAVCEVVAALKVSRAFDVARGRTARRDGRREPCRGHSPSI